MTSKRVSIESDISLLPWRCRVSFLVLGMLRTKAPESFRVSPQKIPKSNQKSSVMRKTSNSQSSTDQLLTHKVSKSLQKIRGPVKPSRELHYNDIGQTGYAVDTTGTITLLNGVAEGSDNVNRLGRESSIHDVSVRGVVYLPLATGTVPSQYARVALVWDNATNGVAPAMTDIFSVGTSFGFPNPNNVSRFTILADRSFSLGVNTGGLADRVSFNVEMDVRVDSSTRYSGTGATVASIQNGALWLVTIGDIGAGSTAASSFLSTRVTFYDVL